MTRLGTKAWFMPVTILSQHTLEYFSGKPCGYVGWAATVYIC